MTSYFPFNALIMQNVTDRRTGREEEERELADEFPDSILRKPTLHSYSKMELDFPYVTSNSRRLRKAFQQSATQPVRKDL